MSKNNKPDTPDSASLLWGLIVGGVIGGPVLVRVAAEIWMPEDPVAWLPILIIGGLVGAIVGAYLSQANARVIGRMLAKIGRQLGFVIGRASRRLSRLLHRD